MQRCSTLTLTWCCSFGVKAKVNPSLIGLSANAAALESLQLEAISCTAETFTGLHAPELKTLQFHTPAEDWEAVKAAVQDQFPHAKISKGVAIFGSLSLF